MTVKNIFLHLRISILNPQIASTAEFKRKFN